MYSKIVVLILFLVATISFVSAGAEEYLNEFSSNNETCEVIDYFVYDYSCPWFFNSDRYCSTVPTYYRCCTEDKCTTVIFNLEGKNFFTDQASTELIDLNYIKYNLRNGNISQTPFQLEGFDVCSAFSSQEIRQESINLAASAAESISPLVLEAEKAKDVKNIVQNARKVGVVSKFSPYTLVAGFTCNYNSDKLNIAVESLVNTNAYLNNINKDYARQGYVYSLSSELEITKSNLKSYVDSPVSMARGAANGIINGVVWFVKFIFNPGKDPGKIDKTEYGVARDAYNKVNGYNLYLHNPNNAEILNTQKTRISEKSNSFLLKYDNASKYYNYVHELKPSFFTVIITNIFKEPNYNLSYGNMMFKEASRLKSSAEKNYNSNKFNSALSNISEVYPYLQSAEQIYLREQQIKRGYSMWPFVMIIALFTLGYFLYKKST